MFYGGYYIVDNDGIIDNETNQFIKDPTVLKPSRTTMGRDIKGTNFPISQNLENKIIVVRAINAGYLKTSVQWMYNLSDKKITHLIFLSAIPDVYFESVYFDENGELVKCKVSSSLTLNSNKLTPQKLFGQNGFLMVLDHTDADSVQDKIKAIPKLRTWDGVIVYPNERYIDFTKNDYTTDTIDVNLVGNTKKQEQVIE